MDYKTFRNILQDYYKYQRNVENIKEQLKDLLYEMTGVKGVQPDKVPVTYNPSLSAERQLELIEKKAELETELEYTILAIKVIEKKLSKLDQRDKDMCLDIIARNISYESYGNQIGYTPSGLWRKVKRDLERVL